MSDKKSRRVVIINNIQSETIDQAIFILKSNRTDRKAKECDTGIAREAQSIIDNYIRQVERLKDEKSNSGTHVRKQRSKASMWIVLSVLAAAFLSLFFFVTK